MAEGAEETAVEADAGPEPASPAAVAIALGRTSRASKTVDAEAAAFLRDQRALIADQRHHLKIQLKHLGLRYFADRLKVGLQIFLALGAIAIALFVAGLVWQAATDKGLVVEAFSVPPDMVEQGVTGEVVASQLEDKLSALQAATDSARAPASYSNDWGHEIKVEIPETGVSISELQRYLRQWLGHETRVGGEVFHTKDGLKLTVRAGGEAGDAASGPQTDLDGLLERGAEALFARTQPYRWGVYLRENGRAAEAKAAFARMVVEGPASERPWALLGSGQFQDHAATQISMFHEAVRLNPRIALLWLNLAGGDSLVGHNEAALSESREAIRLFGRPDRGSSTERAAIAARPGQDAQVNDLLGDYQGEIQDYRQVAQLPDFYGSIELGHVFEAMALAENHDPSAARAMMPPGASDVEISQGIAKWQGLSFVRLFTYEDDADWAAALEDSKALEAVGRSYATLADGQVAFEAVRSGLWPHQARALAHLGRSAEAWALISQTPLDCYDCVRTRGEIADLAGRPMEADRWFAEAVRQGPSLPQAHLDWARARLARGDVDGAIAELSLAHSKGPHFPDPLELWGEALMKKKGDFAGAAAKFAEADRYAPHWGRNHLRWGEALARLGRAGEASAQWRAAAGMDLSPTDRAELVRVQGHG